MCGVSIDLKRAKALTLLNTLFRGVLVIVSVVSAAAEIHRQFVTLARHSTTCRRYVMSSYITSSLRHVILHRVVR